MVTLERQIHRVVGRMGDADLILETGLLAEQAGGAVTARWGDTMVLCTATMSRTAREGQDFFPLSVEYEERLYAAGRIPGSFMRREGRPSERAILTSRLIDRTLRPLFDKDILNEVQIILLSLSSDGQHSVDMLGILAASTALMISDIPWNGGVAGTRIGLLDGKFIVNPIADQIEQSTLDLRVSGTKDAINMVECAANEVDEATMLSALKLAHETIGGLIDLQMELVAKAAKEKAPVITAPYDEALFAEVRARCLPEIKQIVAEMTARDDRNEAMEVLRETVRSEYEARNAELPEDQQVNLKLVKEAVNATLKEEVRRRIVEDGIRPDGRDYTTIRPLSAQVGIIPRVHGSGLFQRGQTQVLTLATIGTPRDSQLLDGLELEDEKRYMHHYNFPPYSTGEAYPLRGVKRREVGHGALAENALLAMIPDEETFPYTIRLVSEVMSSNGSTSMASVCGSTLALMDAGVPIKRPVAGIAMGLIKEGDKVAVLTDIQGMEDHFGDMDFKVAGTERGITALQMDIKISGVTDEVMARALEQARVARLQILEVIKAALPAPRRELNPNAPRMITYKIDPEKIGAVIGPGGKTVRSIQDQCKVKIDISEEGVVFIAGQDAASAERALERVRAITDDIELGQIFTGRITRVETYGVFVEFMPNKEGLVHVSQLAQHRIENVADEFKLNDEIMVMVVDIDPSGRVRLSRQAVLEGWTVEEARARDGGTRSGGGRPNRGGNERGGGGGGRPRR